MEQVPVAVCAGRAVSEGLEVPLGVDGYGGVGEFLGEVEWLVGGGIVPTGELVALAGRGSGLLLTERLLVGLPVGDGLGI